MAWTSPRTWSACEVVTAALMNTHVRDNLNQTFPALITTAGDSVWATGANAGARLAVGAKNTFIVANSVCTAGVQWNGACALMSATCAGTLGPEIQLYNSGNATADKAQVTFYDGTGGASTQRAAVGFEIIAGGAGVVEFFGGGGGSQVEIARFTGCALLMGACSGAAIGPQIQLWNSGNAVGDKAQLAMLDGLAGANTQRAAVGFEIISGGAGVIEFIGGPSGSQVEIARFSPCVLLIGACSGAIVGPQIQLWNSGNAAVDKAQIGYYDGVTGASTQRAALGFETIAGGAGVVEFFGGNSGGQVEIARFTGCALMISACSNANQQGGGITINESNSTEGFSFKNTGTTAHGMTALTEKNTFLTMHYVAPVTISAYGASTGGMTKALALIGYNGQAADTTKNNAAFGVLHFEADVQSGTGATQAASTGNILVIANGASARFLFQGGGDLFADSGLSASAFDSHDDVQLIRALEVERQPRTVIRDQFDAWLKYGRKDLEAAEIAVFNDPAEGGDGSVFVNVTGLQRLHSGAIWQMHKRNLQLEERLAQLERRLLGPPPAGGT